MALPRLRPDLDIHPAPGGLTLRDPLGYAPGTVTVPRRLVPALLVLDGDHDRRAALQKLEKHGLSRADLEHVLETLGPGGFLDDEHLQARRAEAHAAFRAAPAREPAHAGAAYPDDATTLRAELDSYLGSPPETPMSPDLVAIAAPHASFFGAPASYLAAYAPIGPHLAGRTFVILGTSHRGEPDRFGLTRKPFRTPLGLAETDVGLVEHLEQTGGPAFVSEDYAHVAEHALEFQVLCLQHRMAGAPFRILPILSGALLAPATAAPHADPQLAQAIEALTSLEALRPAALFWVLGVDLAHVGPRYGDAEEWAPASPPARRLAARDKERLTLIEAGTVDEFWQTCAPRDDALRWCGTSPLYTFMQAMNGGVRAELRAYEQWSISEGSLVTAAALHFRRAGR